MNAPDKVYVSIGPRQSLITRAGQTLKSDIEYLRKDALLKWAEEEMMKAAKQIDSYGRRNAFMDVIDKIESL